MVSSGGRDEMSLVTRPEDVAVARRFAVRTAAGLGADEEAQDAVRALVSELVANVVLHAGTPAVLVVEDDGDCVRVLVTDGSASPVRQRRPGTGSTTGRGLRLIEALSVATGTHPSDVVAPGGKTIWFTVRKRTGPAERAAVEATARDLFDLEPGLVP